MCRRVSFFFLFIPSPMVFDATRMTGYWTCVTLNVIASGRKEKRKRNIFIRVIDPHFLARRQLRGVAGPA
ncbi:Uncharacterized protein APZ42_022485 [Daphnia magna]|uniref:Secreted protein n=1 Tax=Daphnia magna TaxID=35525 RepID=A0A164VJ04_9CRUS|nr:Uncharacterized protein APZ42_022485 [Daphnia magna]